MHVLRSGWLWVAQVVALAVGVAYAAPIRAADEGLLAVVHVSLDVTAIGKDELRAAFLGSKGYWSGQKVVVAVTRQPNSEAGRLLFKNILQMTPARFRHHWNELELSGRAVSPSAAARIEDVATLVQASPGAISVLLASEADALKGFRVKTVPIKD